jgi:tetratricopeptide (TPR) repeat protein
MRQVVFTKKTDATVEENLDYALNKIDYLLRKVEIYDKALNEFNEIKLTIDEAKENTRGCKVIVQTVKDSIEVHGQDIKCLSDFSNSLLERIEKGLGLLEDRINELAKRTDSEDEVLEGLINSLRTEIQTALQSHATYGDIQDVKSCISNEKRFLGMCISNAHENNLALESRIKELEEAHKKSEEALTSQHKDLCRFQNALVRKGVPIDVQ